MMKDTNNGRSSLDDLEKKWAQCLLASEKAVGKRYRVYSDIKRLVRRVNMGLVDVADHYATAVELGTMLGKISSDCGPTVFFYFAEQIDPRKKGDMRCFRMECRQLAKQLKELDRRRMGRGPLRVIK